MIGINITKDILLYQLMPFMPVKMQEIMFSLIVEEAGVHLKFAPHLKNRIFLVVNRKGNTVKAILLNTQFKEVEVYSAGDFQLIIAIDVTINDIMYQIYKDSISGNIKAIDDDIKRPIIARMLGVEVNMIKGQIDNFNKMKNEEYISIPYVN